MENLLPVPVTEEEPLATVLSTLRMKRLNDHTFEGSNLRQFANRVYGGQVFAQAVIAARATLHGELANRQIHSITAAFLRRGDMQVPTRLEVEDVLDSRSFSTRRVIAYQGDSQIFSARASFQEVQPGVEHESPAPTAPAPDTLQSSVDFFAALDIPDARRMNSTNAVDIRHVDGPIWIRPQKEPNTSTLIWFRLRSPMPAQSSQLLHRAMLAYATDQFMLEPVMRAHGMFWLNKEMSVATLDHAIWWHRDVDMSHWILAELTSPSAQGGRGLAVARYFQDGVHIATMAQEGMVRIRSVQ
ncbi:MAG: thioesterase family protein [Arcanobacterium sp.]|nr:thioesterase family protein [Arcanobacterium sp.]